MPLRLHLLDLREYPVSERAMRLLLSLEDMTQEKPLLVVTDKNPDPLLEELRPALNRGFTYWIPESGPDTWRVLISCDDPLGHRWKRKHESDRRH